MKTIWFIFFGLLLLAAPASAQIQIAYTNADGSVYTYSTNAGGSCTVDSYTGPPWDVTIPTNINGLTVTGIGNSAFYQCGSLTNVTIPDTVTSIGGWAFYGTSLTTITIPDSVTGIGDGAFRSNTCLTAITVAANNAFYCSVNGVLFDKSQTTLIQYPTALAGC